MNKIVVLFLLISLIKLSLLSNSCVKINVVPFQPTQITINKDSNLKKCIYFSFLGSFRPLPYPDTVFSPERAVFIRFFVLPGAVPLK